MDIIKLYQILTLKYLNFSLDEIKNKLTSLDFHKEVLNALNGKFISIFNKILQLTCIKTSMDVL